MVLLSAGPSISLLVLAPCRSSQSVTMRSLSVLASCAAALLSFAQADGNVSHSGISRQILPSTFKPPQVFQHTNLVRTINLEKEYTRETINAVVENVDKQPQAEYYIPFEQSLIGRVGALEVKDKNNPETIFAKPEIVGYDTYRYVWREGRLPMMFWHGKF